MRRMCLLLVCLISVSGLLAVAQDAPPAATPETRKSAVEAAKAIADAETSAAAGPQTYTNTAIDFHYTYPGDWQTFDAAPAVAVSKLQTEKSADSEMEKKGAECAELLLTAKTKAGGVVMIMRISSECLGVKFTNDQLAGVATGMAAGMAKNFELSEQQSGAYSLGSHDFAIFKARGASKSDPTQVLSIDIPCTIYGDGVLCWMAMSQDEAGLADFKKSLVQLGKEPATALVPDSAFPEKKPN